MRIAGILLAAGRGRRFDPTGVRNKLLEPVPAAAAGVKVAGVPAAGAGAGAPAARPAAVVPAQAGTQFPPQSGDPIVAASARHLLAVLPRVIAVVPPADGGVADALRALGCDVTVCPDADTGMAASLVHAIRHSLPGPDAWLVALGDMPFVQPATIRALCAALEAGAAIAAPVMQGRRGNPVGFGRAHLPALLALQGDQGARGIVQSSPVTEVEVDDPGIFRDVDTGADL